MGVISWPFREAEGHRATGGRAAGSGRGARGKLGGREAWSRSAGGWTSPWAVGLAGVGASLPCTTPMGEITHTRPPHIRPRIRPPTPGGAVLDRHIRKMFSCGALRVLVVLVGWRLQNSNTRTRSRLSKTKPAAGGSKKNGRDPPSPLSTAATASISTEVSIERVVHWDEAKIAPLLPIAPQAVVPPWPYDETHPPATTPPYAMPELWRHDCDLRRCTSAKNQ